MYVDGILGVLIGSKGGFRVVGFSDFRDISGRREVDVGFLFIDRFRSIGCEVVLKGDVYIIFIFFWVVREGLF